METTVVTVSTTILDIVEKGLAICNQLMQVKNNKKSCERLAERVNAVAISLKTLANQGVDEKVVKKAYDLFNIVLDEAEALMKKYDESETHQLKKIFNEQKLQGDFDEVNKHLTEAAHQLGNCLQSEDRNTVEEMFDGKRIRKENYEDMKIDLQEWKKLLEETRDGVKAVHDVVDSTAQNVNSLQDQMATTQRDVHKIRDAGAASQTSAASSNKYREQVLKARHDLINRIPGTLLKDLLDLLQRPTSDSPLQPFISDRERSEILSKDVSHDQVTCLVDMLIKKSEKACEIFLSHLKQKEPNLCKELGLL
ncbi:uncharacterized protein LOC143137584 [Alosa pseudoharengus]|uniref:uncharacterized protein LOC143137584 n=1 Tax=Alosa pseudoharengus TaxID=34774 RepID=UPI003F8CA1E2